MMRDVFQASPPSGTGCAVGDERRGEARRDEERRRGRRACARTRRVRRAPRSVGHERQVASRQEHVRPLAPQAQAGRRHQHLDRGRPASARPCRATAGGALGVRERQDARSTSSSSRRRLREVDRPAVVRIDQARSPRAPCPDRSPARPASPSLSATCARPLIIPTPAMRAGERQERRQELRRARRRSARARRIATTAVSYSSFGVSQLVWSLASLTDLSM